MQNYGSMTIGIPVYPGVDLLDIVAPREIFCWVADTLQSQGTGTLDVYYVAHTTDLLRSRDGMQFRPDKTFADPEVQELDLIWVPGGSPRVLADMLKEPDSAFCQYVAKVGGQAKYIASVCEGAILLANTGLLNGYKATTHWAFYPCMAAFPQVKLVPPSTVDGKLHYPRFIHDGNRVTGGGISSGLDEALWLVCLLFGQEMAKEVQITMQYFPVPPVHGELTQATCCPVPNWPQNPKPCE